MPQMNCLRCKQPMDTQLEQCPNCGERVTNFQRTYATRLIDGKYQILDRLGVGGMGEIFKVRHIHLNELRVIKIMRPNLATDEQGLQRFLQEARTSTLVKHRNLAMLYDFAQLDDGSYYMVWEFIDGTNIQKWMAQNGPVPPRLTVEISVQALTGLEHLHSMGLIHRDISPENIMLSQDHHGKLLVKVIDFGIAKSLAEGETAHGLTQTGMFLGKLKYASPEQAGYLKEGERLDPRSDLYSFGILVYEMLAGRAPFQATNPQGYILKHVTEKPAPIAETSPGISVPPQLEALVLKALEKSRDKRFASAAEFAAALEAIRDSIPPDPKYGLGERIVTLSAARTLAELPRFSANGTAPTFGSAATQEGTVQKHGSTRSAADEATLVESAIAPKGAARGAEEATVRERIDGTAESTLLEGAGSRAPAAEKTLLEPAAAPPRKGVGAIAAAAALVLIALGVGVYFMMRDRPEPVAVTTAAPSGAEVTTTAAGPPAIGTGQGVLLLSASPWGDIEKIVNASSRKAVDLSDESRSTPTRIELDPGRYTVVLNGPNGSQKTFDVTIDPGARVPKRIDMTPVNIEELEKEVKQP